MKCKCRNCGNPYDNMEGKRDSKLESHEQIYVGIALMPACIKWLKNWVLKKLMETIFIMFSDQTNK